jgi:hypothetical protein
LHSVRRPVAAVVDKKVEGAVGVELQPRILRRRLEILERELIRKRCVCLFGLAEVYGCARLSCFTRCF